MANLVTGEAVELDLPYAKLATRGVAFGIDVLLQGTVLLVLLGVVLIPAEVDTALLTALSLLVAVGVLVGYPTIMETLTGGRTLGKLAMGLRVVREDGGPIGFRHALIRALGGFFVDFWALGLSGCVAVVVSLSSQRGKRVGDFLAGTVVIRTRATRQDTTPVAMPPHLAQWAAQLDVSAIPDGLALAMRQYVGRLPTLDAAARAQLGDSLAADVNEHLATPVPRDHRAPEFLAAVLAERRRREAHRLAYPGTPAAEAPMTGAAAGPQHATSVPQAGAADPWAPAAPAGGTANATLSSPQRPPAGTTAGTSADHAPPAIPIAPNEPHPAGDTPAAPSASPDEEVSTPPYGTSAVTGPGGAYGPDPRSSAHPFAPPE